MISVTKYFVVALTAGSLSYSAWEASAQVMPIPSTLSEVANSTETLAASQTMRSDTPQSSATALAAAGSTATAVLTPQDIEKILSQAEGASSRTVSYQGIRTTARQKRACRHHIFIVDRNGNILGSRSMPDAWTGSIDIALGKARTAVFFSSNENALSTRQIGQFSQPHGPDGTGPAGPLWGIGDTNQGTGTSAGDVKRNSIVTFPGGLPLYKNGKLVGGIGVSGDSVDQDESVAFGGAEGFMPGPEVVTPTPLRPKPVDWFPVK